MASEDCDRERFAEAEERAQRALYRDYRAAGEALRQIRDEERPCWVPIYRTWERYLRERWGISRQHGCYLIQAAEVAADVSSKDDTPRLPLRHAALLHRFKNVDVRRELATAIAPLKFPDAQRHVIAAAHEALGETEPQASVLGPTEAPINVLRGIASQCRGLDMNTTVKAISSLGVRRQKKVLAEIDFAAAYLASLHAIVRERSSQVS